MVICSIRENVTRFFTFLLAHVVWDVTSKPMRSGEIGRHYFPQGRQGT